MRFLEDTIDFDKLEIIKPNIFPKDRIISGVTTKNLHLNPNFLPYGMSFGTTKKLDHNYHHKSLLVLSKALGIEWRNFKFLRQVHSDSVIRADGSYKTSYGDALYTDMMGIVLGVKIADCAGILLFDPVKNVIAAIHSGWRGTYKRILLKVIETLNKEFQTEPKNLLAYVSPCASGEMYEVGEDFLEKFPHSTFHKPNGKVHFDNRKEILRQFETTGVPSENIEVSDLCTISNHNLFSYRREKENFGHMLAFIGMRTK